MTEDLQGGTINNVFDISPTIRMENIHLSVLPLEKTTCVLAFYHKRDKKYKALRKQVKRASNEENLKFFNWLIFKYTENYFFAQSILPVLEKNEKLKELSHENSGFPNFGMVDTIEGISKNQTKTARQR